MLTLIQQGFNINSIQTQVCLIAIGLMFASLFASPPRELPSAQQEQTPVIALPQADHHQRCVSEVGLQLPGALRNKLPRSHSASDSSTLASVSDWPCDPENIQPGPGFDYLDRSAIYDVAAFDFSAYSPQPSIPLKDFLPSMCIFIFFY